MEQKRGYPVFAWIFGLLLLMAIFPLPALATEIGPFLPDLEPGLWPDLPDLAVSRVEFQPPNPASVGGEFIEVGEPFAGEEIGLPPERVSLAQGETAVFVVIVENRGRCEAPAGYHIHLVLCPESEDLHHLDQGDTHRLGFSSQAAGSVDDVVPLGVVIGAVKQTGSIPPGGESLYLVEARIPEETPAGLYRVYAVADPHNLLAESDEENNLCWWDGRVEVEVRHHGHEPVECEPPESVPSAEEGEEGADSVSVPLASPREVLFRVGQRSYIKDGQVREMDVAPFIKDGRTQVPVRHLAYALGLTDREIRWDPVTRRVTLTRGATRVELDIGRPVIIINGTEEPIDVAPLIVKGRTFLPARYVAQAFGLAVGWDEATRTVRVVLPAQQPLNKTAEYAAFNTRLAEKGYRLNWNKRVQKSQSIGGKTVEVVCVPSEAANGEHAELIIARDAEGKLFAQVLILPGLFDPDTWALGPETLEIMQGLFEAASDYTPAYCTEPRYCLEELSEALQCVAKPWECLFRWIKGGSSEGRTTINIPFNTDVNTDVRYKLAGKLQAWKIYKAMTGYADNHSTSVSRISHSGAYSGLTVTHDSLGGYTGARKFARFLRDGFRLEGKHGVNFNPAGHSRWKGTDAPEDTVKIAPADLIRGSGTQTWLFKEAGEGYTTCVSFSPIRWDSIHVGDLIPRGPIPTEQTTLTGGETFDDLPLEIYWSMDYNPDTGILTVKYGAKAEASFGLYNICKVSLYGKAGQKASVQLDGSDVQFSFDLLREAGVKAECGICPCGHAEIGGGAGLIIEVTNPDPCNVVVSLKFYYGWGGHGDAPGIMRWACDNREVPGPVYKYNVCTDENVQAVLKEQGFIEGRTSAELAAEIEKLLKQYKLPEDLGYQLARPLPEYRLPCAFCGTGLAN